MWNPADAAIKGRSASLITFPGKPATIAAYDAQETVFLGVGCGTGCFRGLFSIDSKGAGRVIGRNRPKESDRGGRSERPAAAETNVSDPRQSNYFRRAEQITGRSAGSAEA